VAALLVKYGDTDNHSHTETIVEGGQPSDGLRINGFKVEGVLQVQYLELEGSKTPFVIDPVDRDRVFVNSSDDAYEDGAGKFWALQK